MSHITQFLNMVNSQQAHIAQMTGMLNAEHVQRMDVTTGSAFHRLCLRLKSVRVLVAQYSLAWLKHLLFQFTLVAVQDTEIVDSIKR